MDSIKNLSGFPFSSMQELADAFHKGKAEPIVPIDFARNWASSHPKSRIRYIVPILFFMPFIILIFMIVFSNWSDTIKWYHVLGVAFVSMNFFTPMANLTLGKAFRSMLISAAILATVYFFWSGSKDLGILFLLSLGIWIFYEVTYLLSLKELVSWLLEDKSLVELLWERKIMSIRFTDGKVISNRDQV
jgi:hypothetical protein